MDNTPKDLRFGVYVHDVILGTHLLSKMWMAVGIRHVDESGIVTMDEARSVYLSERSASGRRTGAPNRWTLPDPASSHLDNAVLIGRG